MKKIPTAEEIMTKVSNEHSYETWGEMMYDTHEHSQIEYTREAMIEFAKLHVEAALESAVENAICFDDYIAVDKQSILAIAGLIGVFLLGGYLNFDWFKGDVVESPKRLTPEIKLIINDNKVDTIYVYKLK